MTDKYQGDYVEVTNLVAQKGDLNQIIMFLGVIWDNVKSFLGKNFYMKYILITSFICQLFFLAQKTFFLT